MRYFLISISIIASVIFCIAGSRGELTRNRPIEIFPDMDRQPKVRPQAPSLFDEILGGGEGSLVKES